MKFTSLLSLAALAFSSAEVEALPMPRTKAPGFENLNAVVDGEFTTKSLSDYAGKYLVLVFYPFDFTYVCPTELISFSENLQKFRDIGAEVVGVSTDSHFTHLAWIKTPRDNGGLGKIDYPLLADISKNMSRDYGVLVEDPEDGMNGAALRGLFIIDTEGKVRSVQVNDDAVGRSVDETLRLIQGFQFADKNGEVCPANWQPGDATIKPDQVKKMDFFKSAYAAKGKFPEAEVKDNTKFHIQRLNAGDGKKPAKGTKVQAHYTGTLLDGTKFDSSVDRGQEFVFTLGVGQVIKCWDEGFSALERGQKAILNCPADYAYGKRGAGGLIPPNATLKFEVELIDF